MGGGGGGGREALCRGSSTQKFQGKGWCFFICLIDLRNAKFVSGEVRGGGGGGQFPGGGRRGSLYLATLSPAERLLC